MANPLCQKTETKESQRQIWKVGKSQVWSLNVKYTLLSTRDTTEPLTDVTLPSWSSTGLAKSSLQCSSQCWLPSGDSCTLAPQDTRSGIWVRERAGDTITQQNFPLSSCLWPGSQTQNAMLNDALSPKIKNTVDKGERRHCLCCFCYLIWSNLSSVCYSVSDVLFSWGCLNVIAPRPVDSPSPLSALMGGTTAQGEELRMCSLGNETLLQWIWLRRKTKPGAWMLKCPRLQCPCMTSKKIKSGQDFKDNHICMVFCLSHTSD